MDSNKDIIIIAGAKEKHYFRRLKKLYQTENYCMNLIMTQFPTQTGFACMAKHYSDLHINTLLDAGAPAV